MGSILLRDLFSRLEQYNLDDMVYVPAEIEPQLDTAVEVMPFNADELVEPEGFRYLLGIEQMRDAIDSLALCIKREPDFDECRKAVLWFAAHDAFIDPRDL